ncbi:hypothetical protein AB1Y20_008192 [Prymnesium parvum]|uniref:Sodium/glucose cotransporter n=1 Tax=Prymnesium parvum TaxID=97485 RepID=A0AB34ISY8_PRYPA
MSNQTAPPTIASLSPVDVLLITGYFLMVALVGVWFWLKERRASTGQPSSTATRTDGHEAAGGESDAFFLAGRSMRWPEIGLSLFVSNIGSEHLLGLAGSAANSGLAVGLFEWSAGLHILVLGWLFAPVYLHAGISTLPEFLERRYSSRLRSMLSCVSLFIYLFTKLSVSVYSGATVLSSVFGWQRELAATGLVLLTAAYTALGGLAAVIVTDVAQSAVLLLGAACMAFVAIAKVGGLHALRDEPPPGMSEAAWASFFRIYRPADDADFPTLGMLLGLNVGGLWYWCLDQAIVQRVLSARSVHHAKASTILAGFLKTTPVFLMVLPGIVARKLFAEELSAVGCPPKCNEALPLMMTNLLPPGLLGLNLAATVAACMSSLDSVFTAAASLFCLDIYKVYLNPSAEERKLVAVGRVFCAVLAICTVLWLPVIDLMSDQVFTYIQSISMYLAPPIVTVYFLGVLWWRANAQGATAAFVVGYALGFTRMVAEITSKVIKPPSGSFFDAFVSLNYLYVGVVLCCTCTIVQVVVSLLTPRPTQAQLHGLVVEISPLRYLRRVAASRFKMHPSDSSSANDSSSCGPERLAEAKGNLPMLAQDSAARSAGAGVEMVDAGGGRHKEKEDSLPEPATPSPDGMFTEISLGDARPSASQNGETPVEDGASLLPTLRKCGFLGSFENINNALASVLVVVIVSLIAGFM